MYLTSEKRDIQYSTFGAHGTLEALWLPSRATEAADDPEGTFMSATLVDLGRESTSGGLDR